jgi:diguanylate cyclase (GGDEF)-like protein
VAVVDLVARVGGEEFAIALPDVTQDEAVVIVERLRTSLVGGTTGSAGLAVWDGVESAEQLQSRADRALYRAKAQGRDRLVVA